MHARPRGRWSPSIGLRTYILTKSKRARTCPGSDNSRNAKKVLHRQKKKEINPKTQRNNGRLIEKYMTCSKKACGDRFMESFGWNSRKTEIHLIFHSVKSLTAMLKRPMLLEQGNNLTNSKFNASSKYYFHYDTGIGMSNRYGPNSSP